MVPKRKMNKYNWATLCLGILVTLVGYALVAPITRDYETPKAFFAILTINLGILLTIIALAVPFSKHQIQEQ